MTDTALAGGAADADGVDSADALRSREARLFAALSIVVGVLAGLSAVLFTVTIDWVTRLLFGFRAGAGRTVLVPIAISIATGFLLRYLFPGVRGSGVPQTEAAYKLEGGVIPWIVPIGKFISGAIPKEEFKEIIDDKLKVVAASNVPAGQYYDKEIMAKGLKQFRSKREAKGGGRSPGGEPTTPAED